MHQIRDKWDGFSVLIPFHHRHDLLKTLLERLEGLPVLIVDDGSDESLFKHVQSIRSKGRGFASAVNTGLEYLKNQGISCALLLNDDAEMAVKDIETMLNEFHPKEILSPVIQCNERNFYGVDILPWGRVRAIEKPTGTHEKQSVDAVYGTAMMLCTTLRFDTRFGHGFEDLELCKRMKSQGYEVTVMLNVHCRHLGGASLGIESEKAQRWATYGQLRLYSSLRLFPIIATLSLIQILRERGGSARYYGFSRGVVGWLCRDCPSLAARMASSRAGSNKAK